MGKDIIAAFFGCGIAEYASYTCIFDSFQPYNGYDTNELLNWNPNAALNSLDKL